MSNISVDVSMKGISAKEIKKASDEAIETVLEMIGLQAEGYAIEICPVDTGRLRDSITHTVDGHSAVIGTNVEYASYVELGTSKREPHPYLAPAIQNHLDEYKRMIEEGLKR